jgi:hypothetical protein
VGLRRAPQLTLAVKLNGGDRGQTVGNILTGIIVNAAVCDGLLYRVSYSITLEGRIVFTESMPQ